MNRMHNRMVGAAGLMAAAALMLGASGCRVHVDKGDNGRDKNVQVDTPFGGVHVNTDQTSASDLGMPAYPGAQIVRDKDNDKSADVRLGFGEWELRVKAVNYSTADSQDKVEAFYKSALGRYGDVIVCQNHAPVGKATATSEGLTCDDHGKKGSRVQVGVGESKHDSEGLQLKAGSERHQHIVGFEPPVDGQTRFSLVAIDLPAGVNGSSGNKD
jgi:hypothetical protein